MTHIKVFYVFISFTLKRLKNRVKWGNKILIIKVYKGIKTIKMKLFLAHSQSQMKWESVEKWKFKLISSSSKWWLLM